MSLTMDRMAELFEHDKHAIYVIQNAIDDLPNRTDGRNVWPAVSELPVNEFGDVCIFTRAFPWGFLGGIGDPKHFEGYVNKSIQNDDTKFGSNLTYYNKDVFGSISYWHCNQAELCAWLNHHHEVGHGLQSYFITLSSPEY